MRWWMVADMVAKMPPPIRLLHFVRMGLILFWKSFNSKIGLLRHI